VEFESDKREAGFTDTPLALLFPMAELPYLGQSDEGPAPPVSRSTAERPERSRLPVQTVSSKLPAFYDVGRSFVTSSTASPSTISVSPRAGETNGPPLDTVLVGRADALIRSGDISGARLLLERAASGGSAQAAFRLGETYDPAVLSKLGTFGIRGDTARARELYSTASKAGIQGAAERLEALH
jgi:hypothetical protein